MTVNTDQYRVALRYVTALLDLAEENKTLDKVDSDFADLHSMLTTSADFQKFIASPIIRRDQKIATITALAKKAKLSPMMVNFLMLLASNRRLQILATVINVAAKEIADRKGQVTAFVETAHVLSDKQTKDLKEALKKGFGKDINLSITEDKDLLGGMVVRVGSIMVDDSVKTRINLLQRRLRDGSVNINKQEEVA